MNKPRIPRIAAVFALAAVALAVGVTIAAVTDDGSDHPASGSLAVTSGAVALAAAGGGTALLCRRAAEEAKRPDPALRTPGPQEPPPPPEPAKQR
ncbi:hypothetical protein [Streptomyces sp. NBC_01446]|jgi:hypothetical protein|uniref:hypothetical protein n=1 Tax=Streptomyces sp. NBC_01446 TaxID=2903870 RepID=UPI0022510A8B|nr:hypothetical protein [Streptomyces sp. NBC_01446]MCX4644576.1 hypothetical protein [Streptomyces sp. NBC_01446]